MDIVLSHSSEEPIYNQIKNQIKEQILKSIMNEGDALPSMRKLAKDLHVSTITTKRAYEELEKEGLITSTVGKGSFVAGQNLEFLREQRLKIIEEKMEQIVTESKMVGIELNVLQVLLTMLYEEESS
ncbi:GntR family transcriptional regulator [Chengkuizengella sediminis]|uniref:GntR family transcriptional regulator n=1 Tax=Chengkuizengella sediminis TaxID=1885917 RepID=UPI00138A16F3|nr:GntR family transcriptional regulator [Chengkuizengella sediminis]NDI35292.1 GntR family transcriptional regulator [Chengkuizengella sediminis]